MKSFLNLLLLIVLMGSSYRTIAKDPEIRATQKAVGIFVNGLFINVTAANLTYSTKGYVSLRPVDAKSSDVTEIPFRVFIKHRVHPSPFLFGYSFDENFKDGQEFKRLDLDKVMPYTKPGDQIILFPIDKEGKYLNSKEGMTLSIAKEGC